MAVFQVNTDGLKLDNSILMNIALEHYIKYIASIDERDALDMMKNKVIEYSMGERLIMKSDYVIEKRVYELIMEKFASQVLRSIKNYGVKLEVDNALDLVKYEDCLNGIISSDKIQFNEGNTLIRFLNDEEAFEILENAKNEKKTLDNLKDYLKNEGGNSF